MYNWECLLAILLTSNRLILSTTATISEELYTEDLCDNRGLVSASSEWSTHNLAAMTQPPLHTCICYIPIHAFHDAIYSLDLTPSSVYLYDTLLRIRYKIHAFHDAIYSLDLTPSSVYLYDTLLHIRYKI